MLAYFTVKEEVEQANIGWNGLNFDMYLHIFPVSVMHMNKSTLFSNAMEQAVEAIISKVDLGFASDFISL